MRITRRLRIAVDRKEGAVGTPIIVRVRDDRRRPVAGAFVTTETKSVRTDDRGLCRLRLDAPGFWKIVAAKSGTDRVTYEPASALVRVLPNEAALRPLGRVGYR